MSIKIFSFKGLNGVMNVLGVCRTYQLCKKWLPNFRSKTVENTLNSLVPSPHICCYNMLILFA